MRILLKQLKHVRVETTSGIFLGHVHDCVLDVGTHSIVQYQVRSSVVSRQEYLVHPQQVVSITAEKMVVFDAVETDAHSALKSSAGIAPDPLAMRQEQSLL